MFGWKLHNDGKLDPGAVVAPTERLGWGRTIGLGAQHVVAMFGATFVFPLLMGLNPQLAVMMSGVATLIFLFVVNHKVPSYLGSSASFVGVATAVYNGGGNPATLSGALFVVGLALFMVGLIIHFAGARVIHRALPPVVTGAVVMLIGFNLAPVVAKVYCLSGPPAPGRALFPPLRDPDRAPPADRRPPPHGRGRLHIMPTPDSDRRRIPPPGRNERPDDRPAPGCRSARWRGDRQPRRSPRPPGPDGWCARKSRR